MKLLSQYALPIQNQLSPISLAQILSLDVVLGGCASTMFIAKFLVVPISFSSLVALGSCVWLIYTADHLLDAYHLKKKVAHTARHRYHQTRFKSIAMAWIVVALLGGGVLFFLSPRLIYYGALLLGGVITYFVLTKYTPLAQWLPKEFMTALFYTTGVFLPALAAYQAPLHWNVGTLFFQYFFLALGNLLLFSWFEVDIDRKDGYRSFALDAGRSFTRNIVFLCLAAVIISSVFMLLAITSSLASSVAQLTILVMALVLLVITLRAAYFQKNERYRLLGDGVFLLPAIPLLLL